MSSPEFLADVSAEHLQRAVRRGSSAVFLGQLGSQLISLVVLAILLRTLGLEPYGLMGMVLPLLALVRIFIYCGLDVAAIQYPRLSPRQASALFWTNQVLGILGTAVVALSGPWISRFYHRPELLPLCLTLSGTMLVSTLGAQHQALLQRQLQLGRLYAIRVASQIVGGIAAVIAAWLGAGLGTLVLQQYMELFTTTVLAWWATGWRPQFVLRGAGSRELLRFGGQFTVSSFLLYLMSNVDKILVGRFLGTEALAIYGQAFNLAQKPVGIVVTPLTGVMLPALARARSDGTLFRDYVKAFFRFLFWAMLPCGIGLALVADETMAVLGGEQWIAAGPILRIFALMIPLQALFNVMGTIYSAIGRADQLVRACVPVAVAMTLLFLVSLPLISHHPQAVAILAWIYLIFFGLVLLPGYVGWALRTAEVPAWEVLRSAGGAVRGCAVMILTVLLVAEVLARCGLGNPWVLLPVKMLVGMAAYFWATRADVARYLHGGLQGLLPSDVKNE